MKDPCICSECIGSSRFSDWIVSEGKDGSCEMDPAHDGRRRVVTASALARKVDEWFRDNYIIGDNFTYYSGDSDKPSYEQRGEPYENIIAEELECEEDIVRAVDAHLPDVSDRDIMQGGEPFYDSTASYESIASAAQRDSELSEEYWFENRIYFQWTDFCQAATHRRRFFGLKSQLDDLFGDPKEYESGQVCPIYKLAAGQKIYRARLLDDPSLIEKLSKAPAAELGAPPADRARAGRMNVEFIPAFYGAFSEKTAAAEIRPGVGEVVAIGEFELQRSIRVFDFTVFAQVKGDGWKQAVAHTRYEFIDQMESEISKPIMPYDKQREYIPTQIVAEYLGECFGCEAVIYRSSMVRDSYQERRNIVLLNKGVAFQGQATSVLSFNRYDVKEVHDIAYDLRDHIPF